jgi:hypothetical protein
MAVDTTFYLKKHNNDLAFAIEKAQEWINLFNESLPEGGCGECQAHIRKSIKIHPNMPRAKLDRLHDMIEQVLFSSGYYADINMTKKKSHYDVLIVMIKMTPEQKADCLSTSFLD